MRLPVLTLCAAAVAAVSAPPAGATPLDVRFVPPEVEREPICLPRPSDAVVTARWRDWDGLALPDRSTGQIRRDMRLLRSADAARWFDTILRVTERLHARDPDYSERDMLMDRIEIHVAAGRLDAMREAGLVETLTREGPGASTRAQVLLSELLRSGIGVPADRTRGLEYLASAGYAGNTEALLELAELTAEGESVPGWDVPPELAVTLAFGGLVGELDDGICDRLNRIANEFRSGDLVRQDMALAEEWYRLSADLGDFNAAWAVARMHMESDGIVKDNATLLRYLGQAAEAGLPYALSQLARIHDVGALAPHDPDRARALYARAAEAGDQFALVRLTQLLDALPDPAPEDRAARARNLERLTALDEPPAWAFIQLAEDVLQDEGRWAGAEAARALYRRALEQDPTHTLAISRLARLSMETVTDAQSFEDVVAPLARLARSNGSNAPMGQLRDAYLCRSPRAPETARAAFWEEAEAIAANLTPEIPDNALARTLRDPDPWTLAQVQTQSLSGRGTALAIFVSMQDEAGGIAGDPVRLRGLARTAGTSPLVEQAKLRIRLAGDARPPDEALDLLREAVANGEPNARVQLLRTLAAAGAQTHAPEMRALAETLAAEGNGLAMRMLAELDGGGADARASVRARFGPVIAARGDFDALILALEGMENGPDADLYLSRARAAMICNLPSALDMAEAHHRLGRQEAAETWIGIAAATADDVGWQLVAVGDALASLSRSDDAAARALAMFERAQAAGDRVGILRLLAARDDPRFGLDLNDARTAELYIDLIRLAGVAYVPDVLDRLRFEPGAVRDLVAEAVDPRALYAEAAAAGNPDAQLALARIVLRDDPGPAALDRYAGLLTEAAGQGQAEAMLLLSQAYSYGLGVEPSLEESRRWLLRAAEAGNPEAAATVRLLTQREPSEGELSE